MKRGKGFSLIEIIVVIFLIGLLAGVSFYAYNRYTEKAITTEAIVHVGAIQDAEELHKVETGDYVAAEDTEEITEKLDLEILPKYYEYKVVGVTDDNFIVIAQRIGEDLEEYLAAGKLPPKSIAIAMDKSGIIDSGYGEYLGSSSRTGGGGGGVIGGESLPGGGTSGFGGGTSGFGGGIGETGGGTGGIAGTSGTGGTGGIAGTGGSGTGDSTAGSSAPVVYTAEIEAGLDILEDTDTQFSLGDTGTYYYNLIIEKNIEVVYDVMSSGALASWSYSENKIRINNELRSTPNWPAEAIACEIIHEATHADYDYNVDKWVGRITDRYGYTRDQLTYLDGNGNTRLYYTITEEYFANSNQAELWQEVKNGYSNQILDDKLSRHEQGESFVRDYLRSLSSYEDLPEFYPGN